MNPEPGLHEMVADELDDVSLVVDHQHALGHEESPEIDSPIIVRRPPSAAGRSRLPV
jgi:hypothetical protein